jgi:polygalacturonase
MNRRAVLQLLSAAGIAHVGVVLGATPGVKADALLLRPQDFGAKVDGISLDSPAINAAIDRANGQGGGMVYLSPGVYLCGTVVLKSNVTLYLEAGTTILGSKDVKQYTPQPGPPENADASTRHLIFAKDADNITLCGPGLVDGQGPSFWTPSGRRKCGPDE